MIEGLIGKKIGMTHLFASEAQVIPVTVLEVGPCVVTQVRTEERDGYEAVHIVVVIIRAARGRSWGWCGCRRRCAAAASAAAAGEEERNRDDGGGFGHEPSGHVPERPSYGPLFA